MFHVQLTTAASEMLAGIGDADTRDTIARKIDDLKEGPDLRGKALVGEFQGFWRIQAAGRYRIVYRVTRDNPPRGFEGRTQIVGIGIRKEGDKHDIYRVLSKMMDRGEL